MFPRTFGLKTVYVFNLKQVIQIFLCSWMFLDVLPTTENK
jgi:hypothetical protein